MAELLAAGADPRVVLRDGATALHLAAWKGHAAVIGLLLEHAMVIDVRNRPPCVCNPPALVR